LVKAKAVLRRGLSFATLAALMPIASQRRSGALPCETAIAKQEPEAKLTASR
jgi:hypothetical protein